MNSDPTKFPVAEPDETAEPKTGSGRLPLWTIALCGLLFTWAHWRLAGDTGDFDPDIFFPIRSPVELAFLNPKPSVDPVWLRGKEIYTLYCLPCHQASGEGIAGQYPPLAGSDWLQAAGPSRLIRILLHGFQGPVTVKGVDYNNVMLPWKDTMSDEQIAAVLAFVRQQWGNQAPPVTPDQVKAVRDKHPGRETSWTYDELQKIPEND